MQTIDFAVPFVLTVLRMCCPRYVILIQGRRRCPSSQAQCPLTRWPRQLQNKGRETDRVILPFSSRHRSEPWRPTKRRASPHREVKRWTVTNRTHDETAKSAPGDTKQPASGWLTRPKFCWYGVTQTAHFKNNGYNSGYNQRKEPTF